jgi:hypothetical protein
MAVSMAVLLFAVPRLSAALVTVEPDSFPAGTVLNNAFPGVTLTAIGDTGVLTNSNVLSLTDPQATTGTRVFGDTSGSPTAWGDGSFSYLRADFAAGASMVLLDFAADDTDSNPFLRAFNSANIMVASASAGLVPLGSPVTLSVSAPNIKYITASWDDLNHGDNGILDNLRYSPVPEPGSAALLVMGALAGTARRCLPRSANRQVPDKSR